MFQHLHFKIEIITLAEKHVENYKLADVKQSS